MKRFVFVFLILMMFSFVSFADPGVVLCYRMNHYAAAYNEDHPGYFDYDSMFIDVYLMDDFSTAYYVKTEFANGKLETTGYVPCTVSKGSNNDHILTFPDGSTMSFYYDDDGRFWLKMEYGTYHLLECERFNISEDLKP